MQRFLKVFVVVALSLTAGFAVTVYALRGPQFTPPWTENAP